MGTSRRRALPLLVDFIAIAKGGAEGSSSAPTVDVARRRLGGRERPSAPIGHLVEFRDARGTAAVGVVLFASEAECIVWVEGGTVRRSTPPRVARFEGTAPDALVGMAAEVRVFAALAEGDRVRFERGDSIEEGTLVEKCRYGGLVLDETERVIAVGFRKLWPRSHSGSC